MSSTAEITELGRRLRERGMRIAVAESCTGGLLGGALTEVEGAADFFVGGVISYAVDIKATVLGVSRGVLDRHGPVSQEVAAEMAERVREMMAADIGLSVTGLAGPGGEGDLPAGLTFIGLSTVAGTVVARHQWTGDRAANRDASVDAAVAMALGIV